MALGMVVPTKFTLQDKMSGPLGAVRGNVDKFAAAARSALSRIVPKGGILGSLVGQVALGTLAAKGIEKAFGAVKNTLNSIPEAAGRFDEIAKTSVRLGMSTDALQKYRYAADKAGVSNEQLNTAFMFLNKGLGNGTLVTALEKIDSGLARQVSRAPDSASAFKIISDSMSREGDVAKRTAAMMAAFGRSGNALVTMLPTLTDELKNAEKYGNIIPHGALTTAELFNDTLSRVKSMVQSFGDTVRGAAIQYLTPLLIKLQEWIAANRELIREKITAFIEGAVKAINRAYRGIKLLSPVISAVREAVKRIAGSLSPLVYRVKDWTAANGDLIRTGIQGFAEKLSAAIERLVPWIFRALEIVIEIAPSFLTFAGVLWGIKTVLDVVIGAFGILNAIMNANPISLIVLGIAALTTGFVILASKVGGVGNAFKVVGQTIMKVVLTPFNFILTAIDAVISTAGNIESIGEAFKIVGQSVMKFALTPINLVISAVGGLLSAIGHIPGADWAKTGFEAIKGFQDKMNVMLTGSESTILNSGGRAFFDPSREVVERGQTSAVKKFQDQMNTALTGSSSTFWNSGLEAYADPYREARDVEILRQEAARLAAGGDEKADETNDLLRKLLEQDKKNGEFIKGLGDTGAPGIPGRLSYAQMGQEDFWELARAGL
jgi:hypothetical protein